MISFKKKFPKIYNNVAPILRPKTTTTAPIHLPNIKPPIIAIGEPNPSKGNTHNIVNNKKAIDNKKIFFSLTLSK